MIALLLISEYVQKVFFHPIETKGKVWCAKVRTPLLDRLLYRIGGEGRR
jgi:hypothetical protein